MKVWHGLLVLAGLVACGLYFHAHHPQAEMYVGSLDTDHQVQVAFGYSPGGDVGGMDVSGAIGGGTTGGGWGQGGYGISCGGCGGGNAGSGGGGGGGPSGGGNR